MIGDMQISQHFRRATNGHGHWCPGCDEMHIIPDSWAFNGNLRKPTFTPSVKITGKKRVVVNGKWNGNWERDVNGKAIDECCHYNLTDGALQFHGDCTHALKGQTVPLPELPAWACDNDT